MGLKVSSFDGSVHKYISWEMWFWFCNCLHILHEKENKDLVFLSSKSLFFKLLWSCCDRMGKRARRSKPVRRDGGGKCLLSPCTHCWCWKLRGCFICSNVVALVNCKAIFRIWIEGEYRRWLISEATLFRGIASQQRPIVQYLLTNCATAHIYTIGRHLFKERNTPKYTSQNVDVYLKIEGRLYFCSKNHLIERKTHMCIYMCVFSLQRKENQEKELQQLTESLKHDLLRPPKPSQPIPSPFPWQVFEGSWKYIYGILKLMDLNIFLHFTKLRTDQNAFQLVWTCEERCRRTEASPTNKRKY